MPAQPRDQVRLAIRTGQSARADVSTPPRFKVGERVVVPFPPNDETELAARLEQLLADPALRAELAHAGRRYVEENANLATALEREAGMLAEVAWQRRAA